MSEKTEKNAMSKIDFGDLGPLLAMTDDEIIAEVRSKGLVRTGQVVPGGDSCERCCEERPGSIQYDGIRYCRCAPKLSAARAAIQETDTTGAMTFENIARDSHPSVLKAAANLREVASGERRQGMFMFGLPGRGKTHLQVSCARAALDSGRLVGVYSLASLVSRIQETYGYSDSSETKTKIIEEVASHDIVILDDVGKEHRSPDTESIVYQLVDMIYRKKRVLVASSNLPGSDFVERYDGAVLSRIGGMCEKVVIRGDDYRKAEWSW